jgi:CubicO group peptidase (beta-lactamase class C family)
MMVAASGSLVRKVLRVVYIVVSALLAVSAVLAIAAWRKSSTPLVRLDPVAEPGVDLDAYRRGEYTFPGATWSPADPASLGWDVDTLDRAHAYVRSLDTSSLIVLHRGVPIAIWGDVARRENSQSMRKSLLSSLYGGLVSEGRLDLDSTLEVLGIDDDPPLTAVEKTATVRDLLLSRSGIYHSALYEAGMWKRRKPPRGSAAPGQEWYYNNWGFNALSTIYEQISGTSIGLGFEKDIAGPIGMEDFRPRDVVYLRKGDLAERFQGNRSNHPAYIFMISARDLARFGLLYLADGRWKDRQVLPVGWARESTVGAAEETNWAGRRYGYLWWILPPSEALPYESILASGGRGHKMTIVPALGLVVVHRLPTGGSGFWAQLFRRFVWHPVVDDSEYDRILAMILEAYPDPPQPEELITPPEAEPGGPPANPPAEDDAGTRQAPDPSVS